MMKIINRNFKWGGLVSFALLVAFPLSGIFAESRAEIVNIFVSLLSDGKATYSPAGFAESKKSGMRIFTLREDWRTITYKFDKKNWYMTVEETTDSSTVTADVGMYFKPDKTPIVATSITQNRTGGPGGLSCDLVFEEFSCDVTKGAKCASKDVSTELFPKIEPAYFANQDSASNQLFEERGAQKVIVYTIPRIGTTITAALWLDVLKSTESALKPTDGKMLRYTECGINWIKKKSKFEVAKCTKNMKSLKYFGN